MIFAHISESILFSKNVDIILVEGMKHTSFNKIEVFRTTINKPLLCLKDKNIKALVYDKVTEEIEKLNLPMFQFKETNKINEAEWFLGAQLNYAENILSLKEIPLKLQHQLKKKLERGIGMVSMTTS